MISRKEEKISGYLIIQQKKIIFQDISKTAKETKQLHKIAKENKISRYLKYS